MNIYYFPGYTGMPNYSKYNPFLRRAAKDNVVKTVRYHNAGTLACQLENYNIDDTNVFIGHSMGGLIAKKLSAIYEPNALVTLGSPHQGLGALRYLPWLTRPQKKIAEGSIGMKKPTDNYLSVGGTYDLLVRPKIAYDVYAKNIEVPATHMTLITGERTYLEVMAYLEYDLNLY